MYSNGRATDLGAPAGFTHSGALGISDSGTILAQAWSTGHVNRRFVAVPRKGWYVWKRIKTGLPGYYPQSIEAIYAAGHLVGTVNRPGHKLSQRAAVWLSSSSGTYDRATLLPSGPRLVYSRGLAVAASADHVVVGGVAQTRGSLTTGALWVRVGQGPFRAASDLFGIAPDFTGGRGKHFFIVGEDNIDSANYGEPIP